MSDVKENMTWDEIVALCVEKGWQLDCDNDGQIILYTGWSIRGDNGKALKDLELEEE